MEERALRSVKPYLDKLTLGVTRILEASPGVTEVVFMEKEPAERHAIVSWEQKNACVLPEDLKNFYLMTDGFHMTWSVKFDENPMPLGNMTINSISKLSRLGTSAAYTLPSAPTLADLEDSDEEEGNKDQPEKPHLDSRSLIFELDPCGGNGKVCLVYKNTKPVVTPDSEIWFLDRALYWHFLTKTFTAYYRLLITHLGLPQWQYAFTSYGISPQAKLCYQIGSFSEQPTFSRVLFCGTENCTCITAGVQVLFPYLRQWFNMYKPIILNTEELSEEESFVNKLDPTKVFKSKNKTPVLKKKLPTQPPISQKAQTVPAPKNTAQSGSSSRRREAQS